MHPKFHRLIHLSGELVVGGLQCEDKHRVPKRYARETCNLQSFGRSALANVVGPHFQQLSDADSLAFGCELIRPVRASHKLVLFLQEETRDPNYCVRACDCMQANFGRLATRGTVARGDIVLLDGRRWADAAVIAGEVWALCSVHGEPLALMSVWRKLIETSIATSSAKWEEDTTPELWPLSDIVCPLIYRKYPDGVVTLIPVQYRDLLM